jgi:hypothetical protein
MQKFGLAILIGIWSSVVLVPAILLGHLLSSSGGRQ